MRRLVLGIAVAVTSLIPVFGMADDQQIADFIKGRLQAEQQQGNLKGFNVDMRVEQGTVWFKGHVSNSNQEMTILKTAQAAGHLGVVKVVDDIEAKQAEPVQAAFRSASYTQPRSAPQPQFQAQAPSYQQPRYSQGYQQQAPRRAPQRAPQQSPFRQASSPQEYFDGGFVGDYGGGIVGDYGGGIVGDYGGGYVGDYGGEIIDYGYGGGYGGGEIISGDPLPFATAGGGGGGAPLSYGGATEAPNLPGYAWPGYAASPNYGAVAYPKQHSASAWPYIGPFYPYPQVPLGWRKVSLEWDDGWWFLDFHDK